MEKKETTDKELKQSSLVWSDSLLYRGSDFPKYNPDDLIGRKGFTIYKTMMKDEQLKAVVRFRRDSISGRDWGFEFDETCTLSDEEKERRIAVLVGAVNNIKGSFKDGLNKILASIQNGFSITEKLFELFEFDGKTYWGLKALNKKPFDTFFFVTDPYGDLIEMYQHVDGSRQTIDMSTVIHHVQNIDEDDNYGQSELREAYRAWYSKDITIKFFNIHLERHASGFFWISEKDTGNMPAPGTPDHVALTNIINNFQVKTGLLLPKGLEAKLEKPNNTDAFEKAIAMHDKALAKALLMPNLMGFSEDGGVGSQAKSQTQLEAFLWILDSEAAGLEETMNEQVFRDLSEVNFGDNQYPRFNFKPLSKAMMQTIATTWGDLVEKNAVVPSDDDEEHLRSLMDFPAKPKKDEDESTSTSVDQQTALTGAQVTSMMDVIAKVSAGTIPWVSGVLTLINSFPISKVNAEEMLAEVPKDLYDPTKQPEGDSDGDDSEDDSGDSDSAGDDSSGGDGGGSDTGDGVEDETIMGATQTKIAIPKFDRQERRVNFSEIDRSSEIIINEGSMNLATIINDIVQFFDKEIGEKQLYGKDTDPEVVNDLTVPASFKKKLLKESETFMRDAWELGATQAKQEVEKAGDDFTRKQKLKEFKREFGALTTDAASYFETRAFTMSGKLSSATLDIIKASILTGIKYSKAHPEIVKDIYAQLASFGYLNLEDVEEAIGQALEITNPTHRLNTTVRTSTFEAINESRFNYFTDKTLKGFVAALRYTSILDARTTDVCNDLNNRTYPLKSSEWDKYRPPNHFNCRALLIPVIKGDDYSITTAAHRFEPAQGFK
jgi:SPP1 gp7 family putative phage head morphogenesis protein